MAEFAVNGALFPQTPEDLKKRLGDRYDASKNYPTVDGVINIPADQAYALAEYIMQGKPIGDRREIPVGISGWKKQSASGKSYISLSFKPHYKYEKNAEAAAAQGNVLDSAAASLAKATDGNVIDDVF
jgi:hypothetical protein